MYVTERLERLHAGRRDVGGLDAVIERAATSTDGQPRALATGDSLIVQSLMQQFREEFGGTRREAVPVRAPDRLPEAQVALAT